MGSVRIGVLSQIPNLLKELKVKLPNSTFFQATADNVDLKQSEIIIADFDLLGPIIYDLPNAKFIQGTWAGVDALLPHIKPNDPPNVPIARFSGMHFGRIISEYVLACIVNHERNFLQMYENQKSSEWDRSGRISDYRTIGDLNVGILGVGNIGSRLGIILNSLGATIHAFGRRSTLEGSDFSYVKEYYTKTQLPIFLKKCDYLINTLPNTEETRGILNGTILENCTEKQAIFINVGRGSVVSDSDLITAIEKGWISAAYLDVFNVEPLPKDNKLWKLPQVKISPHVAAMSRAQDIAEQFMDNLNSYNKKQPIATLIDFKRQY